MENDGKRWKTLGKARETAVRTAFGPTGRAFDPFQRLKRRGTDRLSAKFRIEDCIAVYTQEISGRKRPTLADFRPFSLGFQEFVDALQGVEHVFQEVLFVTDGLCGSSCDTAARTAQLRLERHETPLKSL